MGIANFIKAHFLGKEISIFLDTEAETITYDQAWASNKEYFRGVVQDVEDNVIILNISDNGLIYINATHIVSFWQAPFDYHRSVSTSLTRRPVGAKRRDR